MARLRARTKFFLAARKVVSVAIVRDVGTLNVRPGGKVKLDASIRDIGRTIIKGVPLGGSNFTVLIVGSKYASEAGTFGDDPEPPRAVTSAQLVMTITNDPPGPAPAVDLDLEEAEPDPEQEAGEDPTPPNAEVLYNGG